MIGLGSGSCVFNCIVDLQQGFAVVSREVAVKVLLNNAPVKNREVTLLQSLRHPNLVSLHKIVEGPPHGLFLELCTGGTLHELMHGPMSAQFQKLPWKQRITPALDVTRAVKYIHSQ